MKEGQSVGNAISRWKCSNNITTKLHKRCLCLFCVSKMEIHTQSASKRAHLNVLKPGDDYVAVHLLLPTSRTPNTENSALSLGLFRLLSRIFWLLFACVISATNSTYVNVIVYNVCIVVLLLSLLICTNEPFKRSVSLRRDTKACTANPSNDTIAKM